MRSRRSGLLAGWLLRDQTDAVNDTQRTGDREDRPEPPEPRSFLGLPLRVLLAIGSVGLPMFAVSWFSATHAWPPPPPCDTFAIFGCPSAPYPTITQPSDWFDLAGPILGLVCAAFALWLGRESMEPGFGIVLFRYVAPIAGILVSVGCAIQLQDWISH